MTIVGHILKQVGSLWWTNVLLLLLSIAMGVATAYESTTSMELGQIRYYNTHWFQGMLALLAVNATASLLSHWPWTRRNLGFVLTHGSLLIMLIGAAVTRFTAFDGIVGIEEGETRNTIYDRHESEIALTDLSTGASQKAAVPLSLTDTLRPLQLGDGPRLTLGAATLAAVAYSPDAVIRQIFAAIDDPTAPAAAEIILTHHGHSDIVWVREGRPAAVHGHTFMLRRELDADAFAALLTSEAEEEAAPGQLVLQIGEAEQTITLPEVGSAPVPVGESDVTLQVAARYAQAIVGEGGQIVEGPGTQPNPAVEIVLRRGDEQARRMVFANFPDFSHRPDALEDVRVRYEAGEAPMPLVDATLIAGPNGQLAVQTRLDAPAELMTDLGSAISLPQDSQFTVQTWLPHAQAKRDARTRSPMRENRTPALELRLTAGETETIQWLRRNDATTFEFAGKPYRIEFRNREKHLPFSVTLEQFEIGVYPGSSSHRSYTSRVVITDASGMAQPAIVTMNAPLVYGGYTFFQSSYSLEGGQRMSYLSVARDPGRLIVYVGYVGLMLGMVWVLSTRMRGQKPAGGAA